VQSLAESSYSIPDDSKSLVQNKPSGSSYPAAINRNSSDGMPVGLVLDNACICHSASGNRSPAQYQFYLEAIRIAA
jgi:hypothetical protein